MAAFDYAKARNVAQSLVEKFGAAGSFVKESESSGGYDKYGNEVPAEPPVVINGLITPLLSYKKMEIDGEVIKATDSYVFFHSDDEPEIGSTTTVNGDVYRLINIAKLGSVDGINVYRKMQLRK